MADNPLNLATLQQQDPYITEILARAPQVHLYNYNKTVKNEWEKTDVGGALFIYKRSAHPIHGMMILNKEALENWVEPITDQLEFQLQTPFLLYRSKQRIQGIWFHKPSDCQQISELMQRLREEAALSKQSQETEKMVSMVMIPSGQKNVDIMQLLCGAQQRYENKNKVGTEPPAVGMGASVGLIKPTPVKGIEGEGPRNLQQLFENVKLTQQLQNQRGSAASLDQKGGDPPPDVTINPLHRSLSVTEVESGAQSRTAAPAGGLTVEEIERQQRAQIRVPDSNVSSQSAEGALRMSPSPVTKDLLSMIAAAAVGDGQGAALPAMPQIPPTSLHGDVASKGSATASDSVLIRSELMMTPGHFDKQLAHKEMSSCALGTCPDVLMTPMAFTTPQRSSLPTAAGGVSHTALLEQLRLVSSTSPGFTSPPPPEMTPLTRQQLQQAIIHVLRTDEEFIGRVHDAYLASFRAQMGGPRR